ncbi:MAG: hypothetical protein PHI11_09330 [Gallionella sp.]|nr:hypothetical protein [Gallionella sp.]
MTVNDIAIRHEVDDLPLWRDSEAYGVLKTALEIHKVDEEVFARLLNAYRPLAHRGNTRGIAVAFDEIFQSISEDS